MKIESSAIGMESARSKTVAKYNVKRFEIRDYAGASTEGYKEPKDEENGKGKLITEHDALLQDLKTRMESIHSRISQITQPHYENTIRENSLNYLLELLFSKFKLHDTSKTVGGQNYEPVQVMQTPMREISYVENSYELEEENTQFATTGTVKCADGREINFNINFQMSSRFERLVSKEMLMSTVQVCDPLVINLGGNVADVSDQTFYFDIDADGEMDEINSLGSESGYLALDMNGNGKIDDGSELFGTKSGDAFSDLAQYDKDNNGWIDENDEIFSKLKIWTKDENGKDILYTLKEAGVGALCLGRVGTEHSLKDDSNATKAIVRSSGIFLYENGMAGTLQHVDMAKYKSVAI